MTPSIPRMINKYIKLLLTTNVHRRNHNVQNPVIDNKEYKYNIALLVIAHETGSKKGAGIANVWSTMILNNNKTTLLSGKKIGKDTTWHINNNKIDYVHGDDLNLWIASDCSMYLVERDNAHEWDFIDYQRTSRSWSYYKLNCVIQII